MHARPHTVNHMRMHTHTRTRTTRQKASNHFTKHHKLFHGHRCKNNPDFRFISFTSKQTTVNWWGWGVGGLSSIPNKGPFLCCLALLMD